MRFTQKIFSKSSLFNTKMLQFVPQYKPANEIDIKQLENFLLFKPNTLVLTGAGISTESGIPDYRSEGVGLYAKTNYKPIQHSDFLNSPTVRKRYWARNFAGWKHFSSIQPNATHYTLAQLERENHILGIVTQNIDRLHSKAGSKNIVEIHGCGYDVICLNCDYRICRNDFQYILNTLNPKFNITQEAMRPDGDVEISLDNINTFEVPSCPDCGGNLKPNIVFFGDNVPEDRNNKISKMLIESDSLLVLGSSLLVYSGYRILLLAKDLQLPIAIVNIGPTRGDHLADLKISTKCGDIIPKLFNYKKASLKKN